MMGLVHTNDTFLSFGKVKIKVLYLIKIDLELFYNINYYDLIMISIHPNYGLIYITLDIEFHPKCMYIYVLSYLKCKI